jgi:subtilase family serine protease
LGAFVVAGAVAAPARADWHAFRGPNAGYDRAVCGTAAPGQARCLAQVETNSAGKALAAATPAGYGPTQLRTAYSLASSGGSGQTVAIVDAYDDPNAESNLNTYRSTFGIAACTTANGCFRKVNQSGGTTPPAADPGWAEEISLDLDMVSAICPNCHILLVEASSPTLTNLGTAVNTAVRLGATEVSNSYGGSESGTSSYASRYYNHPGVAVTASAGDDGYAVEFPASAPAVTAVGGTSLTLTSGNTRSRETVWSGTGSGCSRTYAQPGWQTPLVPAGVCSRRIVGDVSAVADPGTGVAVYDTYQESGWLVFGGTSVSAPIIASVYALAGNAKTIDSTGEPLPYKLGHQGSNLYDVTSGRNGSCGGSYLCTARAGYDGPTGLGTPIGTGAF